jgi:hypothetical protein
MSSVIQNVKGLPNVGNSCWFNASLQALTCLDVLCTSLDGLADKLDEARDPDNFLIKLIRTLRFLKDNASEVRFHDSVLKTELTAMVEYLIASLPVPTRYDDDEEMPDDGFRDADDVFLSMLDCKFYVSDTAQYKQWDLLTSPSIPKALLSSCPQYLQNLLWYVQNL